MSFSILCTVGDFHTRRLLFTFGHNCALSQLHSDRNIQKYLDKNAYNLPQSQREAQLPLSWRAASKVTCKNAFGVREIFETTESRVYR